MTLAGSHEAMRRLRQILTVTNAIFMLAMLVCMMCCTSAMRKPTKNMGRQAGKATGVASTLENEVVSIEELDQLSNVFADRYFTLLLSASEQVMRDNPSLHQRRVMNGMRLLSVSSMYDIATSPDILTQMIDQLVVVTLQNYYWVDSGKSQKL